MKTKPFIGEGFFINSAVNTLPDTLTVRTLTDSDPLSFHSVLPGYMPTPMVTLGKLAKSLSVGNIYVKDESHRFQLNAFKILGASYAINQVLISEPDSDTFCTATDGNHGRAVAWSAKREGKKSQVFVPAGTSGSRIKAIEDEGGVATVYEGHYDETCKYALKISNQNGWKLIQDTSVEGYEEIPALIMAGYTTMFLEMEDSLNRLPAPSVDIVFLQAGVGSFAASAIWYYLNRYGVLRPKIVLVEPSQSDGVLESFKKGFRSKPGGSLKTIMAGLNCGIPSLCAWEIIKKGTDAVIRVDDSNAIEAIRRLYYPEGDDQKIISGESGAAGLAGLLRVLNDSSLAEVKRYIGLSSKSNILLVNTEGDTDPESFQRIVNS